MLPDGMKYTDEFDISLNPMPGEPEKLIVRWKRRLISRWADCLNTLAIMVIDEDHEADMRADFKVFTRLPETEKTAFLKWRKFWLGPYQGRLLTEKISEPAAQLSLF